MKFAFVLLAIAALGYALNHRQELGFSQDVSPMTGASRLIVYGKKSSPASLQLEAGLDRALIPYEKRDMDDPASASELTEKRVRLGKVGGQPVLPVADVDGVLIENASLPVILRRRH